MAYFFTSESVSEGHPDKVADQISDALIDHFLAFDATSKVACETLVTTGQVVLAGEVKSSTYLDVQKIARETINKIGYTKGEYMFDGNSCGVLSAIHEQSPDINQGVERANLEDQGAGDQGMMFGYATNETESYMPLPLELSHLLLKELAKLRRENNEITYLRLIVNLKLPLNMTTIISPLPLMQLSFRHNMTILILKKQCYLKSNQMLLISLFQE